MRKRSILVLLTTLTIGTAVPAAAAPYGCGRNPQCGQNYVDANGDGICDNFVDNNGDGRNDNCPGYGNGQGWGQGQYNTPAGSVKNNAAKKAVVKKAAVKKNTIKKVQRRLNKIGYRCGKINGIMNAKTKNALRKFKKTKGLKANCIINTSTLKALRIS
ncbi:MAG: peptidoglycan-binding protein [Lachnospiraceae bacterium]|jgi:hypothetical protein|nr:peptidoglycan-binding protein [Lachnospiraceae bacterium]